MAKAKESIRAGRNLFGVPSVDQVLDVLRSQSLRTKMPEAAVGQLVGDQSTRFQPLKVWAASSLQRSFQRRRPALCNAGSLPGSMRAVGDIFASRTGSGNEPVIRGIEASALLGT